MKRSSLQKRASKFTTKKFYEINPRMTLSTIGKKEKFKIFDANKFCLALIKILA